MKEISDPVLPKIDHPALLPLVQDTTAAVTTNPQESTNTSENKSDDEEFDDFVSVQSSDQSNLSNSLSAMTSPNDSAVSNVNKITIIPPIPSEVNIIPPISKENQNLNKNQVFNTDKIKHMNLPEVGHSPHMSPTASFDNVQDDEFDDFQCASTVASVSKSPQEKSATSSKLSSSSQIGDKYDVFRQLDEGNDPVDSSKENDDDDDDLDESFGDFCSSRPTTMIAAKPEQPQQVISSTELNSTFEPTFVADFSNFSENCVFKTDPLAKTENPVNVDWNDPFGEFTEAPTAKTTVSVSKSDSFDDDDFGDFVKPMENLPRNGIDTLSTGHEFPNLSEGLGETQSIASLELPGLDVTVGAEGRSTSSDQSPDSFVTAKSDFPSSLEEQLSSITLDSGSGTAGSELTINSNKPVGNAAPSLDAFSSGFADKYSSIREAASKTCHDEAHTGSWQKCLESSVNLLSAGADTLQSLRNNQTLLDQVLETSQMHDYLLNLREVWGVCKRIQTSSRRVTTSSRVDELLALAHTHWAQILTTAEHTLEKDLRKETKQVNSGDLVCGVCLTGGNVSLSYGGHSYHAPCANLWLNCVDLTLPSLTPVTLL